MAEMTGPGDDPFERLFHAQFPRLQRYLDRLSGDGELARDLAQESFLRLYRRSGLPDRPEAWLITVATNLWRNARAARGRRRRLLGPARAPELVGDPSPSPAHATLAAEAGVRVRAALAQLPDRDRELLLLLAEGYRYREIAEATGIAEASIGTLLARAKRAFRAAYPEDPDAP
ncbi:MAG: sigma-70 family RNA polymerase sigma factor [Gemmatimonadetes bacterium]|nr:sigma-70 family RNA polymerase sigma factor [Gemmatimonadota bacterium]